LVSIPQKTKSRYDTLLAVARHVPTGALIGPRTKAIGAVSDNRAGTLARAPKQVREQLRNVRGPN